MSHGAICTLSRSEVPFVEAEAEVRTLPARAAAAAPLARSPLPAARAAGKPALGSDGTEGQDRTAAEMAAVLAGAFLHGAMEGVGLGAALNGRACMRFLELMTAEAAAAGDPLEAVLVQQVAMAHASVGILQMKMAAAPAAEAVEYAAAAARLMAESRRSALEVSDLRRGGRPAATIIGQRIGVAQSPVAYVGVAAENPRLLN